MNVTRKFRGLAGANFLECADQSALWSVATCRAYGSLEFNAKLRRQAAAGQSGDKVIALQRGLGKLSVTVVSFGRRT